MRRFGEVDILQVAFISALKPGLFMTPLFLGGFNRLGVAWVLPGNSFSLRWLVRLRMV